MLFATSLKVSSWFRFHWTKVINHRRRRESVPVEIDSLECRQMLSAAPVFSQANYTFTVDENVTGGYTDIGSVSLTDDEGIMWIDSSDLNFSVNPDGSITCTSDLDYETLGGSPIVFTVTAYDAEMQTASANVTVNVNDVAEDPFWGTPVAPATDWEFFGVSEKTVMNFEVGSIPVFDPQAGTFLTITTYEGDISDPSTWFVSSVFTTEHDPVATSANIYVSGLLDYETQENHEYKLILKAEDEMGHSATVGVTISVDDEPEWVGTGIFLATREVANNRWHTAIVIVPSDQAAAETDPRFSQLCYAETSTEKYRYATLSAYPTGNITNWGNLKSDLNADSVDNLTNLGDISVASNPEIDVINALFALDAAYSDALAYTLIPDEPDEHNSNSYVAGLLNALLVSFPCAGWPTPDASTHPGWSTPIPLSEFGI